MTFAAPTYLLALLVLPALAALAVAQRRRRRRYAVRFPGTSTLAAVAARRPPWRRWLPPGLLALSAAALVVAMARPERSVAVPVEKASVVLVIDQSGSMFADDVSPSRLEAVRRAANRFMDEVPDELQVGFVGYSTSPQSVVEPTTDHGNVRAAIEAMRADGGTATGDALTSALDRLEARRGRDSRTAPAAIVLLSDGRTTAGSDPVDAARRARRLGIPISTVALGTDAGTVPGPLGNPIAVPPDRETLARIASLSRGTAFDVEDGGELDRIYERLGSRIGTRTEQREITAAFAGGGLLLLLGGLGSGLRWRGRLP